MQILALYANDNGEPQQCLITFNGSLDLVERKLPDYNEGSTLFFIAEFGEERPMILDENLNEIACQFLDF